MATREHLTCESVTAKLREFNGNMAAAARSLNVTRGAVFLFVEKHPTLKDVLRECRESMKDHAESSLHRALLAGEAWAVCFYLKTQAKDRGYVERSELTVSLEDVLQSLPPRFRAAVRQCLEEPLPEGGGEIPPEPTGNGRAH